MSIHVIGSGYSGSSAVYEYLVSREDIHPAFGGHEFRLAYEPGGFNFLRHAEATPCPQTTTDAYRRFYKEALCEIERIFPDRSVRKEAYGLLERTIEELFPVSYKGLSHVELRRWSQPTQFFYHQWRRALKAVGRKPAFGTVRMFGERSNVRSSVKAFTSGLIDLDQNRSKTSSCVPCLNQSLSFCRPISSASFFQNPQVIIVIREPDDIFFELKTNGTVFPADVDAFLEFYMSLISWIAIDEWRDARVCVTKFENFVRDHEREVARICSFLGIPFEAGAMFDVKSSRRNVGLGQRHLSKRELAKLEGVKRETCQLKEQF